MLVTVLLALFLFGILYAGLTRYLRRRVPDHGYVGILVVGGDLAILAGYAILAGVDQALILFACMAAAGLPMVIEYADDHLAYRQRQRQIDQLRVLTRGFE